MAFFHAKREDGFQLIRRHIGLDAVIRAHDLVITGEGSFDRTSLLGKAPSQLGYLARKLRKPIWALCGRADLAAELSPCDRLEGLEPHPDFENLTSNQHAKRIEDLAFRVACSVRR
jgi:glycerate kinase